MRSLAGLLAMSFLFVGCVAASDEAVVSASIVGTEPDALSPDTSASNGIVDSASAQLVRESRVFADSARLTSLQVEHGVAPLLLTPGRYEFDSLGTTIELDLDQEWRLDEDHPGSFVLTTPDSALLSPAPTLTFHRPVGFSDVSLAGTDAPGNGPLGYRSDLTLGAWVASIPQLEVVDKGSISSGSGDVEWIELAIDSTLGPTSTSCEPGPCVRAMWSGTHKWEVIRQTVRSRWYEIESGDNSIIAVAAADALVADEFFQSTDGVLARSTTGATRPHPVPIGCVEARHAVLPSGTPWSFSGASGLTIQSDTTFTVRQRPGRLEIVGQFDAVGNMGGAVGGMTASSSGGVVVVRPYSARDGVPLATAASVAAAIRQQAMVVEESADVEIFGRPAIAMEFENADTPIFVTRPAHLDFDTSLSSWPTLPYVRSWIVDSASGPVVVAIEAPTETDVSMHDPELIWLLEAAALGTQPGACHGV